MERVLIGSKIQCGWGSNCTRVCTGIAYRMIGRSGIELPELYYWCQFHYNHYLDVYNIIPYKKPHECIGLILCNKCLKNVRRML